MKKIKIYYLLVVSISLNIIFANAVSGYEANFHKDLTREAINKSDLLIYLKENLDFTLTKQLRGPGGRFYGHKEMNYEFKIENKSIRDWMKWGSKKEDKPIFEDSLVPERAMKHFYNPTYPLYPHYLIDTPGTTPVNISALTRAKYYHEKGYSWQDVIDYYYRALTSEKEIIDGENETTIPHSRSWYFAQTFRGLGQVLHLLEDMGVPAHVRNDAHAKLRQLGGPDTYEELIKSIPSGLIPSPVKFDTFDHYWDSDINANVYGDGLAEYTNYNFVSDDTIFKDVSDQKHYFPYPRIESTNIPVGPDIVVETAEDGVEDLFLRFRKEGDGEYIDPFLAAKYFYNDLPDDKKHLAVGITEDVAWAYAEKLIPKTISYSAGLINRFFRGKFEISPGGEIIRSTITITNKSGEDVYGGALKFYYDDKESNRFEVPQYSSSDVNLDNLILADGDDFDLVFSPIIGAGNYIIVFKGMLGQESNTVIGKVFKFPSVRIDKPIDEATIWGEYPTKAFASGGDGGITKVEFWEGPPDDTPEESPGKFIGVDEHTEEVEGVYTVKWDTIQWDNGDYTLYAIAFDQAGNTAITNINVRIEQRFVPAPIWREWWDTHMVYQWEPGPGATLIRRDEKWFISSAAGMELSMVEAAGIIKYEGRILITEERDYVFTFIKEANHGRCQIVIDDNVILDFEHEGPGISKNAIVYLAKGYHSFFVHLAYHNWAPYNVSVRVRYDNNRRINSYTLIREYAPYDDSDP